MPSLAETSVRKWMGAGPDEHHPFPSSPAKRMSIVVRHPGFCVGVAPILHFVRDPFFTEKSVFVPMSFLRIDGRLSCHVVVPSFAVYPPDGSECRDAEPVGWIHVHEVRALATAVGTHKTERGQVVTRFPVSRLYPMADLRPILRLPVP